MKGHTVLAEPFPRTIPLLSRGVEHPLLRRVVDDFVGDLIEPVVRLAHVTDATPQLTNQIREDGAFVAWNTIEARKRVLEHPRRFATEEAFGFDVAFVHAAPGRAQEQIGDVP